MSDGVADLSQRSGDTGVSHPRPTGPSARGRDERREDTRDNRRRGHWSSEPGHGSSSFKRPRLDASVVPIEKRVRKRSLWDIKPNGYENVTNEMAKLSGLFPGPGALRIVDEEKLKNALNGGNSKSLILSTDKMTRLHPEESRVSRRVIMSGSLESVETLRQFLKQISFPALRGDPVEELFHNSDKTEVLVQLKSWKMASIAVAASGMLSDTSIVIRRPSGYVTPQYLTSKVPSTDKPDANEAAETNGEVADSSEHKADTQETSETNDKEKESNGESVDDGKEKDQEQDHSVQNSKYLFAITNIDADLEADEVKDLLSEYGALDQFEMITHKSTGQHLGIALVQLAEIANTAAAVSELGGMEELGWKVFMVNSGVEQSQSMMFDGATTDFGRDLAAAASTNPFKSSVIQLSNLIDRKDLSNEEDYQLITDSIRHQCALIANVLDIKVPRPPAIVSREDQVLAGVGSAFVQFDNAESAKKVLQRLTGSRLNDRIVLGNYYPEEQFLFGAF